MTTNQSGNGPFWDKLKSFNSNEIQFVQDKKLLSRGLYEASTILPAGYSTFAEKDGKIADEAGYDRRVAVVKILSRVRKVRRRRRVVRKVLVGTVLGKGKRC